MKQFENFYQELNEKDDYKLSDTYKILSPRMKRAADDVFKELEKNPEKFLNSFENILTKASKKHGVNRNALTKYFENETLGIE